jgi:TRAP-type uncharacterized transport system fused permease subunit
LQAFFDQAIYPWLIFLVLGLCVAAYLMKKQSIVTDEKKDQWSHILPSVFLAGGIYFFVEVCLRWSIRSWYFTHLHILVWIALAYLYHRSSASTYLNAVKIKWLVPIVALLLCSWIWIGYKEAFVRYANQEEFIHRL